MSSELLASGAKLGENCSTKGQPVVPALMAEEEVEPTMPSIALTREQYKTLLEDVRNTQNSSWLVACFSVNDLLFTRTLTSFVAL